MVIAFKNKECFEFNKLVKVTMKMEKCKLMAPVKIKISTERNELLQYK